MSFAGLHTPRFRSGRTGHPRLILALGKIQCGKEIQRAVTCNNSTAPVYLSITPLPGMTMSVFAFVATLSFATAFVATAPPMQQPSERRNVFYLPRGGRQSTPVTTRNMIFLSDELTEVVVTARSEFFLWFFGASGSAGIARGQFPKMYKQVQEIRNLQGKGPTLGGETIGLSPLWVIQKT